MYYFFNTHIYVWVLSAINVLLIFTDNEQNFILSHIQQEVLSNFVFYLHFCVYFRVPTI